MKYTEKEATAIYTVGYTDSLLSYYGAKDAFIHKVNPSSGSTKWFKVWGDAADDSALALAIQPDGGKVVVLGSHQSFLVTGQTESVFLMLVDYLGSLLKVVTLGD